MKLYKFFLIPSFFISSICFAEHALECDRDLTPILEQIETLPEGKELICTILEQGPLSIQVVPYPTQFEGSWSAYDRLILVTKTKEISECDLVTTLLFELHNALHTADLEKIYSMAADYQISRNDFIREVEYIEYRNALAASTLLDKGVAEGIFTPHCYWMVPDTFAEHFSNQIEAGHSAEIGRTYDLITG